MKLEYEDDLEVIQLGHDQEESIDFRDFAGSETMTIDTTAGPSTARKKKSQFRRCDFK